MKGKLSTWRFVKLHLRLVFWFLVFLACLGSFAETFWRLVTLNLG